CANQECLSRITMKYPLARIFNFDAVQALLLALLLAAPYSIFAQAPKQNPQRAVLVTGASSGIGRKIVERLASDGFFVYAGVRKEAELATLPALANVRGVRLDVTSAQDISA